MQKFEKVQMALAGAVLLLSKVLDDDAAEQNAAELERLRALAAEVADNCPDGVGYKEYIAELQQQLADKAKLLDDWNNLFLAATMGGLDESLRRAANIPAVWPNEWHQDCAAVAYVIHTLQEAAKPPVPPIAASEEATAENAPGAAPNAG